MNKWQVNLKIWQVNINIWQDDIKIWLVNIIIWQVMAEICHHIQMNYVCIHDLNCLLTPLHLNMILKKKPFWYVLLFSWSCTLVAVRLHSVWKMAYCQRLYNMHVRVCVRISFQRGNSLIFLSFETCILFLLMNSFVKSTIYIFLKIRIELLLLQ